MVAIEVGSAAIMTWEHPVNERLDRLERKSRIQLVLLGLACVAMSVGAAFAL